MQRFDTGLGIVLAGLCALTFSGAAGGASRESIPESEAGSPTFTIADAYLAALATAFPETGTEYDLPGTDHGALSDNSEAGIARWRP